MSTLNIALFLDTNKSYGRGILRGVQKWSRLRKLWNIHVPIDMSDPDARNLTHWNGVGVIGQFMSREETLALQKKGLVVVSVSNRHYLPFIPAVFTDDHAVGKLAAEHLLERGYKHFAFVGFDGYHYSQQRSEGFERRLAEDGRRCNKSLGIPIHNDYEAVQQPLDDFISCLPKPAAIFAANDIRARQVTHSATKLGLNIPKDIAVIGVDNDELQCDLSPVPLSTIELASELIGFQAADLLAKALAGEWIAPDPVRIPPLAVVTRESTDLVAVTDGEVARAVQFIHQNAHRDFHVTDVVANAGISRRVLEVRFLKATKRTIQDEIFHAHIEKAKDLLIRTDWPMPEIASLSGIPSSSRLSSIFRRNTGMTPTRYRRLHGNPNLRKASLDRHILS